MEAVRPVLPYFSQNVLLFLHDSVALFVSILAVQIQAVQYSDYLPHSLSMASTITSSPFPVNPW